MQSLPHRSLIPTGLLILLAHAVQAQNITITAPARAVSAAPKVATTSIYRSNWSRNGNTGFTFSIPYIQTTNTLNVAATVGGGALPSGGGVKFVLSGGPGGDRTAYDMSTPFTASFTSLAKAEYRLDTYIVDAAQSMVTGAVNQDWATDIGVGDIFAALGDSVTAGWDGVVYSNAPYADWISVPQASSDSRNFPQMDNRSADRLDVQMVSHHSLMNNKLAAALGYPVFILNEGMSGINTTEYGGFAAWPEVQARWQTLKPNRWLIHLGINDGAGSQNWQDRITDIVNLLVNTDGAQRKDIFLAVPACQSNWHPYWENAVALNGISPGPNFNDFYINHTSPVLYAGVHPNVPGHVEMGRLWALSIMCPQVLTVSDVSGGVRVAWSDLGAAEPSIAGYKIKYGTAAGQYSTTIDVGAVTQKLLTGLTPGQAIYATVSAYDNDPWLKNETKNAAESTATYTGTQSGSLQTFAAYNDLGWTAGQLAVNITTNSPLTVASGNLKDFVTGSILPIQLALSMPGSTPGASANPAAPTPGSDAYTVFSNKVSCDGYTYWVSGTGQAVIDFYNLETNRLFTFALYMNRGLDSETYSNRWADVLIREALSYSNRSSAGTSIRTTLDPNDTTRSSMANTAGRLVRFDAIKPSALGRLQFIVTPGGLGSSNVYLNAFMLSTFDTNSIPAQTNPPAADTGWIAYNDCLLDTNDVASPAFTTNSPLGPQTGTLKAPGGSNVPVQVSFSYDGAAPAVLSRPFAPPAGTPADSIFTGHVGPNGAVTWTRGTVSMTLSGMNTGRQYSVVLWSTRGSTSAQYSNRWTDIVISGADSFANNSSAGNEKFTSARSNDGVRVVAVLDGGRVARYDSIRSGADGILVFQLTANGLAGTTETNGYLNAFMVQEMPSTGSSTNDANSNGMPDGWEVQYFGSTNALHGGMMEDWDVDGFSNYSEFRAGTNPTDPADALRVADVQKASGTQVVLQWPGVSGKTYTIKQSTNLLTGWSPLQTGIPGVQPLNVHTVSVANPGGFWRISVD